MCSPEFGETCNAIAQVIVEMPNSVSQEDRVLEFRFLLDQCAEVSGCKDVQKEQWKSASSLLKWLDPGTATWTHYLKQCSIYAGLKRNLFTQTQAVAELVKMECIRAPVLRTKTEQPKGISSKKRGDVIAVAVHRNVGNKVFWAWTVGVLLADPTMSGANDFSVTVQIIGARDQILLMRSWGWREFVLNEDLELIPHSAWYEPPRGQADRQKGLNMGYNPDLDLVMSAAAPKGLLTPISLLP